ncbi:MAG: RDD family protein [Alphaproteobacteria bacterium]|nr:RDD family protein [Alphaproteobacteria bacterium]
MPDTPWPVGSHVPDPLVQPHYYEAVPLRRMAAYFVDVLIVGTMVVVVWLATGLLTIMTFGLAAPIQAAATAAVPLLYHSLLIGGPRSSTLGMRLFGLRVVNLIDESPRPSLVQALVMTVVFYVSVMVTGFVVLVVALFNPRRRTLHDWASGTVVMRLPPEGGGWA